MHIGLNLVYLVPGETGGMETYARELLPALVSQADEDTRFTAFVCREAAGERDAPWGSAVRSTVVPVSSRRRAEWVIGEQWHLPRLAREARVDVVHSLATTAPLRGPFRRVTTVHDLNYHVEPRAHFGLRGLGMRVLVPRSVRASHRLIAISQQTRDDLLRILRVDPGKIDVIPQGVGLRAQTSVPAEELRVRHGIGERAVVLSVSAKRPHKNLRRLLDALALIDPAERPVLILPGYPTPHEKELRAQARLLGIEDDVRFLGWVTPSELEGLYALASCVVFPSLFEGFGLPILEAMSRRVPVACSSRGAPAEVAGSAALLFDPESTAEIARAIERLLTDPATAKRLRSAGVARSHLFSWERTATATLDSYERALRAPRS